MTRTDGRNRLVVGVDYGTTYSGAAYLSLNPEKSPKYDEVKVIQTWPGGGGAMDNRANDKAPTEIAFEDDGSKLWGYEIPSGTRRYGCFKLLLDEKTGRTKHDDPNLDTAIDSGNPNALLALPPGKDVHDITFEYMYLLYEHIMSQLRDHMERTFDSTPIQFVLTTPAIWSHEAQTATLSVAKKAGFASRPGDTITMVSEPEAAASYCLREMHERSMDELQVGERFLVCDAGGGTVDLITYEITQVSPCLRVKEAYVGDGGKCGSTAIDREFLKWLEPRVGKPFKKWSPQKKGRGSTLMENFESVKRAFGTSSYGRHRRVPLGRIDDNPDVGIEDCEIKLTNENMAEICDPIVKMVIELVSKQIIGAESASRLGQVSKILLVGGFGESQYLYTKLKKWCQSQPFPVDVMKPLHPWSAVVRGAVIHGIDMMRLELNKVETLVTSRVLTKHYGVVLSAPYDPEVHDKDTVFYDPLLMQLMASDQTVWFAAKGQDARNGQHFPITCCSRFPEWMDRDMTIELVGSPMDDAPVSAKRGNVLTIGRVEANLRSVPDSAFHTVVVTPRGRILHAEATIDMLVGSAELSFEIMFQGKSYGKTQIEY